MIKEGRFSHLKRKKHLTVDEFAAEANNTKAWEPKSKLIKDKILLFIAGRMNRMEDCTKPFLLHLRKDIKNDIERYCLGNMNALLNYLVRRGLDDIIEKGEKIIEEHA